MGKLPIYLTLELGLKGNKNICKVTVYSNFVVFLWGKKAPKHCPKCRSVLCGRWEVTCAHSENILGLGESQEGLPATGLQPHSSETTEVVAVTDFPDDN